MEYLIGNTQFYTRLMLVYNFAECFSFFPFSFHLLVVSVRIPR